MKTELLIIKNNDDYIKIEKNQKLKIKNKKQILSDIYDNYRHKQMQGH